DFVFTKRQTAVSRLIKHEPERSGPHDVDLAVWTNSRHSAFDGIVTIETVAARIRDAKRHRECLSLIRRAREINLRVVFWIRAAVHIESRPREIHIALEA